MKKHWIILLLLLAALPLWAVNYYVSVLGSNNNNGITVNTPFQTIQKAADLASGGDTVFVMAGTYNSSTSTILKSTRSGAPNQYITFKGFGGQRPKIVISGNVWNAVILNGSYVVFEGFELEGNNANITYEQAFAAYTNYINGTAGPLGNFNTNGISIGSPGTETRFPHHVIVRNCWVHDFPGGGISAIQTDYVTIENNRVYNNAWYMMYGGSGISILTPFDIDSVETYKNIVRNNFCHTNKTTIPWSSTKKLSDGNGIIIDVNKYAYGGSAETGPVYKGRTLVESNVAVNNGGSGIHAFRAVNVDFINNTVFRNGTVLPDYANIFANDCVNVNFFNNISYATTGTKCNSTTKNVNERYNNNIYFNGSVAVKGINDTVIDPKFVNISTDLATGNFRLQSTSPAIDAGSNVIGQFSPTDILGVSRPQGLRPDCGAYEYVAGVGVRFPQESEKIKLFPNPVGKTLTVELAAARIVPTECEVFDLAGRSLKTQILTNQNNMVNVSELSAGLYLFAVRENERLVSSHQLVKQ